MNVSSENNPFEVLNHYNPTTETLCVEKQGDKQILTVIDRKVADSRWNMLKKLVGWGPLKHKDTSVEGVQECLVKLFLSKEDNPLKTMDPNSKAYVTTEKIAHYAANRGMHALENVMALKTVLKEENLSEIAQKEITFNDNDPADKAKFVELLERRREIRRLIEEDKQELVKLQQPENETEEQNFRELDRQEKKELVATQKQLLSNTIAQLELAQEKNEQAILVRRYGTEDAKKLSPEDRSLFFKYHRMADLFDNKKSKTELNKSLYEFKRMDSLKLFVGQAYFISEDLVNRLSIEELDLLSINATVNRNSLQRNMSLSQLKALAEQSKIYKT